MELKDRLIIVTGAGGGIGGQLTRQLVRAGARVAAIDLHQAGLDELQSELGDSIEPHQLDLTQPEQVDAVLESIFEKNGEINALVNNAGMTKDAPLINVMGGMKRHPVDQWSQVIDACLNSVFYMTSATVPWMIKKRTKGVIVNVGSVCAAGNAGQSAYSAAKAGVEALTHTWAQELNLLGIRVACVAPGFTETQIVRGMSEKVIDNWKKRIPLRRFGEPREIASAIQFILENDYFNAKTLPVDGGLVI